MENKIKINSYYKVWRIERKIYSIGNIHLPAPINPNDAISFLGVVFVIYILQRFLPFIAGLHFGLKYIALPFIISKYLMKKKLDGKNPISYLAGLTIYFCTEFGTYLEVFEKYRDKELQYNHNWDCWYFRGTKEKIRGEGVPE